MQRLGLNKLATGVLTFAMMALVAAASSTPVAGQAAAVTPAGKWKFIITTPHGEMAMALEMKVEGKKISGTLSSEQTGQQPLIGEYVEGKLTFSVSRDNGDLKFIGKFKNKDTIVGDVAAHGTDMPCIAKREKE